MLRSRLVRLAIALAAAWACCPLQAGAEPLAILLAHTHPQRSDLDPLAAAAAEFRAQVASRSAGAMKVDVLADGVVGNDASILRLSGEGVIHGGLVAMSAAAAAYPPLLATQVPFAFAEVEQARAVFAGPLAARLGEDMAARSPVRLAGFVDSGGFDIITNLDRDVSTPEEMWGLRMRALLGYAPEEAMIRALEAHPVGVSLRDERGALASTLIDGQAGTIATILVRGLDALQGHATITNHLYAPYVWVWNASFLAKLDADQRRIVDEAAAAAIHRAERKADALVGQGRGEAVLARRMVVHKLSPAEREAFREAMRPAVEEALRTDLGEADGRWLDLFIAAAGPTARP
ncbi:TRAP transporter substrate-binding protein DctP [Magnetospirillum sp. UT-4]|uniref:TRAP transporter substrate-binding protein DctP n=1 Tax=Magnetospirillum sp. UT-4 TaxID=2681467 RepID=UPI001385E363|nr:TRAP transporter substrate-binding protein DctP [Magnetospirillum sp. UT-4]CAA7620387.1 putative extracellular solute-binding protein, TRAP-type C4-dicarboxylate transport system, periplasmic component [Magnetospirillum sp. UT-4]